MMEWISVKERMPELKRDSLSDLMASTSVLIYNGTFMAVGFFSEDDDEDSGATPPRWFVGDDGVDADEITHWQSLPEPPK